MEKQHDSLLFNKASSELKNRNTKNSCINLLNYHDFSSYHSVFPELSPNELQTAAMYSLGITPSVIALKLNISITTIFTYLRRAKEKFELDNISEIKTVFLMRVTTQVLEKLSLIEFNGGSKND